MKKRILLLVLLAGLAVLAGVVDVQAKKKKERKPPKDIETIMTERGDVVVMENFDGEAIPEQWRGVVGKWEIEDGALKGTEQEADHHGAVSRIELDCTEVIVQYSFMLKGSKGTSLSFNNKEGHVCRASFNPAGLSLNKDRPTKTSEEQGERLDAAKFEFKDGVWYDVCVEILGKEMLASIGGDKKMMYVVSGENDGVGKPKTNFGFTVAGVDQSIYFDNVRVWKSLPNKKWERTKKKLEAIKKIMEQKGLR